MLLFKAINPIGDINMYSTMIVNLLYQKIVHMMTN